MPVTLPLPNLDRVDHALIAEVCRRFGIKRLAVFGSLARGEAKLDSDVDVLIEMIPGRRYSLWTITEISDALSPAFEGRRVDLCRAEQLHPMIRPQVAADEQVLYAE